MSATRVGITVIFVQLYVMKDKFGIKTSLVFKGNIGSEVIPFALARHMEVSVCNANPVVTLVVLQHPV